MIQKMPYVRSYCDFKIELSAWLEDIRKDLY